SRNISKTLNFSYCIHKQKKISRFFTLSGQILPLMLIIHCMKSIHNDPLVKMDRQRNNIFAAEKNIPKIRWVPLIAPFTDIAKDEILSINIRSICLVALCMKVKHYVTSLSIDDSNAVRKQMVDLSRKDQKQYAEMMKCHVNKISCLISKKIDVNKHINNLSSYHLSFFEKLVICRGLKFSLLQKVSPIEVLASFEKGFWKAEPLLQVSALKELASSTLRSIALNYIHRANPNPPKALVKALNQLKKHDDIVITKPDKGSGVVVMDKTELLEIATTNQLFQFNGQLCSRIDGVAMGSPLGPLMANTFMCHLEDKLKRDGMIPEFYKRFVHDALSKMPNAAAATFFLEKLNDLHPNLSFTMELPVENKIPFVGMEISRDGSKVKTQVYQKSTNTGLLLHFNSHTDKRYKEGLLKTMVHRAYALSSTREALDQECSRLHSIFTHLDYPTGLIDSTIQKVIKDSSNNETWNRDTDESNVVRFCLPFKDQIAANAVRKQMVDPSQKVGVHLQPVFTGRKFEQQLKPREVKVTIINRQCVVYKFQCDLCDADYIGFTARHLHQRIAEHKSSTIGFCYHKVVFKMKRSSTQAAKFEQAVTSGYFIWWFQTRLWNSRKVC
ncbi:Myosin light chain kinase, smooth muscle, partial [Paramuricea clavata]